MRRLLVQSKHGGPRLHVLQLIVIRHDAATLREYICGHVSAVDTTAHHRLYSLDRLWREFTTLE